MMQRDISDKNTLGETLNPYNGAGRSTAIDRTTSNYNDAKEKLHKLGTLLTWENMMLTLQNISQTFLT